MSVVCEFIWGCDRCKKEVRTVCDTSPYDDPIAAPPAGWDFGKDQNTFMCKECLAADSAEGSR